MIRKKRRDRTPVIDLTGPEGNAFVLLGYAMRYAEDLGLNGKAIATEMKSGNYEHLVEVFDKYFGDYVVLER